MRRILKLSVLSLAAGVVSACNPDEVIRTEDIPTGGVRFINALPDTNNLDFRFIDIVESNAHFRIPFRNAIVASATVPGATLVQYKNTRAGSRSYRIFLNDTLQAVASSVLNEGTITVEANKNYTVLLQGYANPSGSTAPTGAPAMQVVIYEEAVADPGNLVALRVINTTMNTIDAYQRPVAGAFGAPDWPDVAPLTRSGYVNVTPDTIIFQIQDGASTADLFTDTRALVGIPPNSSGATDPVTGVLLPCGGAGQLKCDIEATPGTTIAGSAITALVFPGSVPCTTAPQTSGFMFTTGARFDLSATATGFARVAGSFITDAIPVGPTAEIGVCGFTQPENNGKFIVTGRTATTLTVTKVGGGSTVLEAGTPVGSTGNYSATATGYARVTGSFVTEGFVPNMRVAAAGFTSVNNNGVSTVTAVSATTLTVTKTPATTLEAATTGLISMGVSATGYTRSAGSFVTDGWVVGQPVTASGFVTAQNNGPSTVSGVTATELSVAKIGGLVAEIEAPGRTVASSSLRSIGNATLRNLGAPRPAIAFIWDRRPPRAPGL